MTRRMLRMGLCSLAVLAFGACASEVADTTEPAQQVLAELEVDGAHVQFVELEPGSIVILARSRNGTDPLADRSLRALTPVQLYEHWTDKPAPQVLLDAPRRAAEAARNEVHDEEEPVGLAASALTGEEFESRYCPPYKLCLKDHTGTFEKEVGANGVDGYVNPIVGDVKVQIRVKKITGWGNILVDDIFENELVHYWGVSGTINNRPMKVKIFEADGDTYHFAMDW